MLRRHVSDLVRIIRTNSAYAFAVGTAYGQMALNIVVQILLIPLYLHAFGEYEFGILMIILSFTNYAALGVSWLTGGLTRLLAERFAREDERGFAAAYALGKHINVGYAALVAIVGVAIVWSGIGRFLDPPAELRASILYTVLFAALYLIALYSFSIDRVALNARGEQAASNLLTMFSQIVFVAVAVPAILAGYGLPAVMLSLAVGVIAGQVAARVYWRRLRLRLGWRVARGSGARAIMRRLLGRTGLAFTIWGAVALTLQADALLVGWLAGPKMVTQFVLVWKAAEVAIQTLSRLVDMTQPYLIHMDVRAESDRLHKVYGLGQRLMWLFAGLAAVVYALLGPWIVGLWVGTEFAPTDRWGYVLAGGAIFWLTVARFPTVLAYATVRLRPLIATALAELVAKLVLVVTLFPFMGFLAPLAAINLVHIGGIALAYQWIGRQILKNK